jgi:hypothetical protein
VLVCRSFGEYLQNPFGTEKKSTTEGALSLLAFLSRAPRSSMFPMELQDCCRRLEDSLKLHLSDGASSSMFPMELQDCCRRLEDSMKLIFLMEFQDTVVEAFLEVPSRTYAGRPQRQYPRYLSSPYIGGVLVCRSLGDTYNSRLELRRSPPQRLCWDPRSHLSRVLMVSRV